MRILAVSAVWGSAWTGCTESTPNGPAPFDAYAAGGVSGLAPPAAQGLAALDSDFQTTSLSLLDPTGALAKDDCVDSATGASGSSSKTISGDATLPSQPQHGGNLVIVDRGNGALTFVDPAACSIVRQIAVPGGAKTDPHDLVIVSDGKAYVTRYDKNLAARDPSLAGNDLAIVNPQTGAALGRIPVDAYASVVAGATVLARPDRALIAGGRIVVSLDEIDAAFGSYGEGKVLVVDPATDQVTAVVDLTGLYDCEGMDYVPATETLLVSCGGSYGVQDQALQSGIAVVDLGSNPPELTRTISAVAFDDRPLNFAWVLAAPPTGGGTRAFASSYDPKGVENDALFAFDYVIGTATSFAAAEPFTLGREAATPSLLFAPVGSFATPEVRVYDVSAAPAPKTGFPPDPAHNLPPQEVAWY